MEVVTRKDGTACTKVKDMLIELEKVVVEFDGNMFEKTGKDELKWLHDYKMELFKDKLQKVTINLIDIFKDAEIIYFDSNCTINL